MELRKFQYFESVARLCSFTRAAEELHVAQPTITTAIKRMEEELGVPLLVRDKRSVVLTYEGEIFLEKVKDILQRIDQAVVDMQDFSANRDATVNIGIAPISGAYLTSLLYKVFSPIEPHIKYKILELGSLGILDAIDEDKIDMGYLILLERMNDAYEICPVQKKEIKVLLHKENPLSEQETISIQDLRDQELIYYPQHSFIRKKMDMEFQRCQVEPKILAMPQQMIALYSLVQNNAGVSFTMGDAFRKLVRSDDLVARSLEMPVFCEVGVVWKKGKKLNRASRKCLEFILEQSKLNNL